MWSLTACLAPPVGLIVSHLPFGPTAYFTLCNVVMRHDVPDLGTMSEAKPHLIVHGFSSCLGKRVSPEPQAMGQGWGQGLPGRAFPYPSLCSRSLTFFVTCSLCPKMTVTASSPLQTRMTTSPSGVSELGSGVIPWSLCPCAVCC